MRRLAGFPPAGKLKLLRRKDDCIPTPRSVVGAIISAAKACGWLACAIARGETASFILEYLPRTFSGPFTIPLVFVDRYTCIVLQTSRAVKPHAMRAGRLSGLRLLRGASG